MGILLFTNKLSQYCSGQQLRTSLVCLIKIDWNSNISNAEILLALKGSLGDCTLVGTENAFIEDWGEQMTGKSQTVIVTLDLDQDLFQVWSRQDQVLPFNICPGQVLIEYKYLYL